MFCKIVQIQNDILSIKRTNVMFTPSAHHFVVLGPTHLMGVRAGMLAIKPASSSWQLLAIRDDGQEQPISHAGTVPGPDCFWVDLDDPLTRVIGEGCEWLVKVDAPRRGHLTCTRINHLMLSPITHQTIINGPDRSYLVAPVTQEKSA